MKRVNNDETMIAEEDNIKAALIEILNCPDNLSKFSEALKNHNALANKTLMVELKFLDTVAQSAEEVSDENAIQFLSAPLATITLPRGTTWCPFPACSPPPGKWI